jgi:hypothetical protein
VSYRLPMILASLWMTLWVVLSVAAVVYMPEVMS